MNILYLISNITINIGNEKWAQILVNSISVDKEVNPDNFQRQIIQQNEKIIVYVICYLFFLMINRYFH